MVSSFSVLGPMLSSVRQEAHLKSVFLSLGFVCLDSVVGVRSSTCNVHENYVPLAFRAQVLRPGDYLTLGDLGRSCS